MNPYQDIRNENTMNVFTRTFETDVLSDELIWHRDRKDRIVKVLSGENWMLQFDNELPFKLNLGEVYKIPLEKYHRLHKGAGKLVLEIKEN